MIINRISVPELLKRMAVLPKPNKIGLKTEFVYTGQTIFCESDVKRDCFKLEWRVIEIK